MASGTSPTLRPLEWPAVVAVDLAAEFPWLILHQRIEDELAQHHDDDEDQPQPSPTNGDVMRQAHVPSPIKTAGTSSPYKQMLCAPREPPPVRSPAQRAARRMLRLQEELDRRDEREGQYRNALKQCDGPRSLSSTARANSRPRLKPRPPLCIKKHKRQPADTQAPPEARLEKWLARQRPLSSEEDSRLVEYSLEMEARIHLTMSPTLGTGLWTDQVASEIAAELTSESVFGGFVSTRRMAFQPQSTSTSSPPSPQKDMGPVLPVDPAVATHPDPEHDINRDIDANAPVRVRPAAVELCAEQVYKDAHSLVDSGNVPEALAVLQAGIDRVLHDFQDHQDEIIAHGFNYSKLAHEMATRLQLKYKARHRRRLCCLVKMQRAWRRFRVHQRFITERRYQETNLKVIQRFYKRRHYRRKRESNALRIQRCFRLFQEQKCLLWWKWASRMLLNQWRHDRERHQRIHKAKRSVRIKLEVVLRVLYLLRIRRYSICCMQKRWRGWTARHAYSHMLAVLAEKEQARRLQEDEFVHPRLQRMVTLWGDFFRSTTRGKELVRWKFQAPLFRWRRLRASPQKDTPLHEIVDALCRLYGPGVVITSRWMVQAIGTALMGKAFHWCRPTKPLYGHLPMQADGVNAWIDAVQGSRSRQIEPRPILQHSGKVQRLKSWLRTTQWHVRAWRIRCRVGVAWMWGLLLWCAVVYPILVVRLTLGIPRIHEREAVIAELVGHQRRHAESLLRRVYRVVEQEQPNYTCAWCGAGFGTVKSYYTHRNIPDIGCVALERCPEQERRSTRLDVAHIKNCALNQQLRRLIARFKRDHKYCKPDLAPRELLTEWKTSFTMQNEAVRRLKTRRRNCPALHMLLDIARCCGQDLPSQRILVALLAHNLFVLNDRVHPLELMHAFTTAPQWLVTGGTPGVEWVGYDEAVWALGWVPQALRRVWLRNMIEAIHSAVRRLLLIAMRRRGLSSRDQRSSSRVLAAD